MSFNPDVFGGLRREAEAARATAEAAGFQLAAVRLTLVGNVVATANHLASLDAQVAEQQRIIAARRETVMLGRFQEREGQIARADVAALEAQLAAAEAALPPIERSRAVARDGLAALTGRAPDRPPGALPRLEELTLPTARCCASGPPRLARAVPGDGVDRDAECGGHAGGAGD